MSLGQHLVQEAMQMGGAELPLTLKVSHDSRSASTTISQWSPLAVGVEVIAVSGKPAVASLGEIASQLAQKLNYLSEPVRVFEVDSELHAAQLRSHPPRSISDGVEYFELRLAREGAMTLHRYRNTPSGPRTAIPFTLTLETLARVIDDLSATP